MDKRADKPVQLTVDGQTLTFTSLYDFEFCLDARTSVPAAKMLAASRESPAELRNEAQNIRTVEKRFTDLLARSAGRPGELGEHLRELDRHLFSQDYRWRALIGALEVLPPERDEFHRAALVRYLQYLRSRQEALREAYVQQRRRDDMPALADPREEITASEAMRETSIFDVEDIPSTVAEEDGYATLRRGETVKVPIPSQPMEILMSRHKFVLIVDGELVLRNDEGKRFALKHGRNAIGRDLKSEVVLDAGYRDISRCHLIIDTSAPHWLQLTDMSSHGTRVASVN